MNLPLITIVTVTYNSAKYVRDAIKGVLAQTYSNIEYIIADDCSTDDTWQIIQEYKDERILAYRNETNLREYPNRNKAIDQANGKYLIFIDGDDFIYPYAVEILTKYMENAPLSGFSIMCAENNKYLFPIELTPKEIYSLEFSNFSLINVALSHTFYRTEILKINKFEIGEYYSGDTLNRLKIALNHNCLLVNNNLTWWRVSENQASNKLLNSFRYEQFLMSKDLFCNPIFPLGIYEQKTYLKETKKKIAKHFFSLILHGSFINANILFKVNKLKLCDLFFVFYKSRSENPIFEILKNKMNK